MVTIGHIHRNQEGRCGHKDELKAPEANVGHWEELIITDVLTARLGEKRKGKKNIKINISISPKNFTTVQLVSGLFQFCLSE